MTGPKALRNAGHEAAWLCQSYESHSCKIFYDSLNHMRKSQSRPGAGLVPDEPHAGCHVGEMHVLTEYMHEGREKPLTVCERIHILDEMDVQVQICNAVREAPLPCRDQGRTLEPAMRQVSPAAAAISKKSVSASRKLFSRRCHPMISSACGGASSCLHVHQHPAEVRRAGGR